MHIPSSTYRVQLNKDFTFKELNEIIDYLHTLGISTIYAAPVLKSRPGSMHGYDVIDPSKIDKEIGTYDDLKALSKKLKEKGMYWLQDIVPNHMAFDVLNQKLMDVLERGTHSPYYSYFDIDWNHPDFQQKLCVPFLGKELHECVRDKELKLSFSTSGFTIDYYDTQYPLSISALDLLCTDSRRLQTNFGEFVNAAKSVKDLTEYKQLKKGWISECNGDFSVKENIDLACERVNASAEELMQLLSHQFYTLTYWKLSEKQINYRRFFTVNELICLRMEDKRVFDDYHGFIKKLYDEGVIQGVRIDHIDGLYDPAEYVGNLRKLLGADCYIIAEKILEAKEDMPVHWQLEGTSGYEFLSFVSQLLTDMQGARKLVTFYKALLSDLPPYPKMVFDNKKLILENYMHGEWDNLTRYFIEGNLGSKFDKSRLKQALALLMLSLPVYRIYPSELPLKGEDLNIIKESFQKAIQANRQYKAELDYFQTLFTEELNDQPKSEKALKFLKRLMQFTGPLTAKGVEDTTFYVYNPLISHDEVGDAPSQLGISIDAFHRKMEQRQKATPLSLNATATHDTKRGEDARLRLNILSEMPAVWEKYVNEWVELNKPLKRFIDANLAPSVNDEYFIYQSLLGGFPEDLKITEEFFNRFDEFLVKAIREGKVHSNWSAPNEAYEKACKQFVFDLFDDRHSFADSFVPFAEVVTRYANLYALGQVLIKATAPGIPDIYQGCELWDLSFVDPDNRRPVDYTLRKSLLEQIQEKEREGKLQLFHYLKTRRSEGVEKLFVTSKVLNFRRTMPELFISGKYIPLKVQGMASVVLAFARMNEKQWCIVAVPLALAGNREQEQPYAAEPDEKKFITLPDDAPKKWKNIFTGEIIQSSGHIPVFDAFKDFPIALFTAV